jgi:sugar phosphate isomerase/epimerase
MAGDYSINDIYQGGYSSLKPTYGDVFTGYKTSAGSLGMSVDPRSANILQEASKNIATGIKHIEVGPVQPAVFESIPKQHLKEMNRLSKLTGVDISLHAPIVEPSGLTEQKGFTESNRISAERQMFSAVEKSHEINPDGNIPVTFHSSVILPGQITEKGEKAERILVINQETGGINPIPLKEERNFPGEEIKGKTQEEIIQKELQKVNEESWLQGIQHMSYSTRQVEGLIDHYKDTAILTEAEEKLGKALTNEQEMAKRQMKQADAFLNDGYQGFKKLFEKAYDYAASNQDKETLLELKEQITEDVTKIGQNKGSVQSILLKKEIIEKGIETLNNLTVPETYIELNDFAKDKTVKTFANVAFDSYKKFKDKSPIISIENPPAGGAFSTGEELREVVEDAREKFIERAMSPDDKNLPKDKRGLGMSKKQAQEAAEKTIGVTWDVGHINMLRKYGRESEDIVKETEAVAPLVKHVHLSDNFGFEHTELPMGMGNVPIKEIMGKLDKEGFDAKKIIEAGNWWEHFKTPPFKETLQAFGSPLYSMEMGPYWNQTIGLQQGYGDGYGMMLPSGNYEMFGAGFSQLPTELGGQKPGAGGSRMSGKPME